MVLYCSENHATTTSIDNKIITVLIDIRLAFLFTVPLETNKTVVELSSIKIELGVGRFQ